MKTYIMISKATILMFFFACTVNLSGQKIGIINIDSISTYSIIGDSSFIFCNKINRPYLGSSKKLVDSLDYRYKKLHRESSTIHGSFTYFEKQVSEIQILTDTIQKLEKIYNHIQHILNEAIYKFTIQEIKRYNDEIKMKLQIKLLVTEPPIFVDFAKTQNEELIRNVTQEVINLINNSISFKSTWLLFKQEIEDQIKVIEPRE